LHRELLGVEALGVRRLADDAEQRERRSNEHEQGHDSVAPEGEAAEHRGILAFCPRKAAENADREGQFRV
jgi:hypothetical protein